MILKPFKVHSPDGKAFYEGDAAPKPAQPVEAGEPCSPFKCEAAQQDGVLCADDSCDIATGVRSCVAAQPASGGEHD